MGEFSLTRLYKLIFCLAEIVTDRTIRDWVCSYNIYHRVLLYTLGLFLHQLIYQCLIHFPASCSVASQQSYRIKLRWFAVGEWIFCQLDDYTNTEIGQCNLYSIPRFIKHDIHSFADRMFIYFYVGIYFGLTMYSMFTRVKVSSFSLTPLLKVLFRCVLELPFPPNCIIHA